MLKSKLLIFFIIIPGVLFSQETIINLGITQSRELKIEVGPGIHINPGESIVLGADLTLTGGSSPFNYTWFLNQEQLGSSKTISVNQPGKYILNVKDSKNCFVTDSLFVFYTSVNNTEVSPPCFIYPNPADDFVYVILEPENSINSLEIYTSGGEKVKSFSSTKSSSAELIDLKGLEQGIYFISIQSTRFNLVKKIIKN